MNSASPLIERDAQLASMTGALDGAITGEGSVVVLSGPAGIGKTALLAAARDDADTRGLRVFHARCARLERDFTFGVIRTLIEAHLRSLPAERRDHLLAGISAPAAVALGLDSSPELMVEASAVLLNAIYWVVAELSDSEPLVLVVDDLQWADAPSLRALAFLANRVEALPLAVLVGVRSGEECQDQEALDQLTAGAAVVSLDNLSADAVGQLLAGRVGRPIEESAVSVVHQATGGNPFWVAQAATFLAETDTPGSADELDEEAWSARALSSVTIGRVARMSATTQAVARAVAVLGDDAAPGHVAELAGTDSEQVLTAASELVSVGLFDPAAAISFAHPLMPEALLTDGGEHARSLAHQRAARILRGAGAPVERIAGHVLRAMPVGDADNVSDLAAAAADAMRRGSVEIALGYLERAAAEPPDDAAREGIDTFRGLAEFRLTRFAEATEHLEQAATRRDAPVGLVLAHGTARGYVHALDETVVTFALEAEARQSDPDNRLLMRACSALAAWYRPVPFAPSIELPMPEPGREPTPGERVALAAHALRFSDGGDLNTAADIAERCLGDGRMIAEHPALIVAAGMSLLVLLWAGRIEAFDREAAHLDELARPTASSEAAQFAGVTRVLRYAQVGDLPAALAEHETLTLIGGTAGSEIFTQSAMSYYLAVVLAHSGAHAADATLADHTRTMAAGALPEFWALWNLAADALVHLACGRSEEALELAERHTAFVRGHEGLALAVGFHTALPLARHACGDAAGALEAAEDFLARERVHNVPGRIATAMRILARVDEDRAVELLTEAVALHEAGPMRLEHATALVELGVALRRDGKRSGAREALEQGADLASACQASPLAARALEELKVLGAKPRRHAFSGVDSLTASERRIADLAATGPTNREIAEQLYVTRKTVENHLANVFRKLDITSRSELATALAPTAGG